MINNITVKQFFFITVQQHLIYSILEEETNIAKKEKANKLKVKIYTKAKVKPLLETCNKKTRDLVLTLLDLNNWEELKEFLKTKKENFITENKINPLELFKSTPESNPTEIVEDLSKILTLMTDINVYSLSFNLIIDLESLFPKLGEDELISNTSYDDIYYLYDNLLNSLIEKIKELYISGFEENIDETLTLISQIQETKDISIKKTLIDQLFSIFETKKSIFSDQFITSFLEGSSRKILVLYKIIKELIKIDFLIGLNPFISEYMIKFKTE
ncbi:hypothetical protein [Mycoplasma leachii]|uniref:hypothetical protein n=1 Tax=Mycoplasma leachii TaxID=2105 RepID=UPI003DA1D90C